MDIIHKVVIFRFLDTYPRDIINVISDFYLYCHTDKYVHKEGNMIFLLNDGVVYAFHKRLLGIFTYYVPENRLSEDKHSIVYSQREHMLAKPGIYLNDGLGGYAIDNLYKAVLSNAVEGTLRNNTNGDINIIMTKDSISIKNYGYIPIIYKKEDLVPEMLFGCFNYGNNYGNPRNFTGYSVKYVNVYSTIFTVVVYDQINRLKYIQTWFNNMLCKSSPIIEQYNGFVSTVEVIYTLDFNRFNMVEYNKNTINLYKETAKNEALKYGVAINFNNELLT